MPFSSPTTTSAVNEKRRPPLTTLATRLISTTRSWRSRPDADTDRSGAAMRSFESRSSVRSRGRHRLERAQLGLRPVDGGQRVPGVVVDELGEDAVVGAEHADARALGAAPHL